MPVITESEMPAQSFSYRKIIGLREIIRSLWKLFEEVKGQKDTLPIVLRGKKNAEKR